MSASLPPPCASRGRCGDCHDHSRPCRSPSPIPTLQEVLEAGNTTGPNTIEFTSGSSIHGVDVKIVGDNSITLTSPHINLVGGLGTTDIVGDYNVNVGGSEHKNVSGSAIIDVDDTRIVRVGPGAFGKKETDATTSAVIDPNILNAVGQWVNGVFIPNTRQYLDNFTGILETVGTFVTPSTAATDDVTAAAALTTSYFSTFTATAKSEKKPTQVGIVSSQKSSSPTGTAAAVVDDVITTAQMILSGDGNIDTSGTGHATFTVAGNSVNSIGGDQHYTIGGASNRNVTGDSVQAVSGNQNYTVGGNAHRHIVGDSSQTIDGVGQSTIGSRVLEVVNDDVGVIGGMLKRRGAGFMFTTGPGTAARTADTPATQSDINSTSSKISLTISSYNPGIRADFSLDEGGNVSMQARGNSIINANGNRQVGIDGNADYKFLGNFDHYVGGNLQSTVGGQYGVSAQSILLAVPQVQASSETCAVKPASIAITPEGDIILTARRVIIDSLIQQKRSCTIRYVSGEHSHGVTATDDWAPLSIFNEQKCFGLTPTFNLDSTFTFAEAGTYAVDGLFNFENGTSVVRLVCGETELISTVARHGRPAFVKGMIEVTDTSKVWQFQYKTDTTRPHAFGEATGLAPSIYVSVTFTA